MHLSPPGGLECCCPVKASGSVVVDLLLSFVPIVGVMWSVHVLLFIAFCPF